MSTGAENNITIHDHIPVLQNDVHELGETSTAIYLTVGVIMTFSCIVGTFFNSMAIIVFVKNKQLRTPTNSFVMALCLCDIFMCLIGMPIPAIYSFRQMPIDNQAVCTFDGFCIFFFSLSSLYILAAISMDRYIVIVRPLTSSRVTQRMASLALAICFFGGLFWSLLPMMGWNKYVHEGIGVACSVSWQPNPDAPDSSYVFTVFVFCFLVPLLVMIFCYANIYKVIRSIARGLDWAPSSQSAQINMRLEKKMLKTILVMLGAFLISWLPYTTMALTESTTGSRVVGPVVETFPALLAKLSALWDPVIYIATNIQFRRAFFDLCPCCEAVLGVCISGDQVSENSQTVLDPESRAVPANMEADRRRAHQEKGAVDVPRHSNTLQIQHGHHGLHQDSITLETKVSPEPEKRQDLGLPAGSSGSRCGGEGVGIGDGRPSPKKAFEEMPPVENSTLSPKVA